MQGRARVKRTMWSRRAQEYDAKINSGDLISISEVVRDLYRADNQPEQSYSERQLYEAALDRMAREIAAVNRMSETEAVRLIEVNLAKGPKRGAKADNEEAEQDRGRLIASIRFMRRRPGLRSRAFSFSQKARPCRPGRFVLGTRRPSRRIAASCDDDVSCADVAPSPGRRDFA